MKIAVVIVRILLGLLFVFSSVTYFFNLVPQPELTGAMKTFNEGLDAATYLIPLAKFIELICGLALLFGRFVPLALVLLSPIVVNILCIHLFLAPEGLPIALFVTLSVLFLLYANRHYYRGLLTVK
ncbi:MAG: DoxX family membrane protein [Mangrovibacterium sp.]